MLDTLQLLEKQQVETPVNWPPNNLIASQIILPIAQTTTEIKQPEAAAANSEINHYNWWFCAKDLTSPSK